MKMEPSWDQDLGQRLKIERTLNFTTMAHQEEEEFGFSRKKISRDPMSHRIIEKRRRDRMNNCLADLSRLIPIVYLKKGRGRIEKTEIIEMATKHLRHLQAHVCKDPATCEVIQTIEAQDGTRQHRMGFQECTSEIVRFLVEVEGFYPNEGVCQRLINHLQEHYDKLSRAGCYGTNHVAKQVLEEVNQVQMEVEVLKPDSLPTMSALVVQNKRSITPFSEHHSRDSSLTYHELEISKNTEQELYLERGESSQLRDILKCPIVPQKRHRSNSNCSSVSDASAYSHHRNPSNQDVNREEVYKFKNNIKERFNADLNHLEPPRMAHNKLTVESRTASTGFEFPGAMFSSPKSAKPSKTLRKEAPVETNSRPNTDAHMDSGSSNSSCRSNPSPNSVSHFNGGGSSSGYSTQSDRASTPKQMKCEVLLPLPNYGPGNYTISNQTEPSTNRPRTLVPVFALHPRGNFYIPMTLDATLLTPFLLTDPKEEMTALHPVSITVNFCRGLKLPELCVKNALWPKNYSEHAY